MALLNLGRSLMDLLTKSMILYISFQCKGHGGHIFKDIRSTDSGRQVKGCDYYAEATPVREATINPRYGQPIIVATMIRRLGQT